MRILSGREDDYIRLPNGQRVSPRAMGAAVYRASSIQQPDGSDRWLLSKFQVVQDAIDHLTLRAICDDEAFGTIVQNVNALMQTMLPGVRCDTVQVEALPLEPSGKLKKVISLLPDES